MSQYQSGLLRRAASAADPRMRGWATLAADAVSAVIAALVAFSLTNLARSLIGETIITAADPRLRLHLVIITVLTFSVLLWYRSQGHYHRRQALADQLKAVMGGAAIGGLCAASVQFAFVDIGSRLLTLSYWAILPPFIILGRMAVRDGLRAAGAWSAPAVLFTCASRSGALSDFVAKRDELGVDIETVVAVNAMSVEALTAAMQNAARRGRDVIYAPAAGDESQFKVIETLVMRGTPFMLSPEIGPLPNAAELLDFPPEDVALMDVRDSLARPMAASAKRAVDIIAAGVALVFLAPVMATIAVIVRMDGGPALFRQTRIGRNGEHFDCLKFRSMVPNAEACLRAVLNADPRAAEHWRTFQKLESDPRITTVGRFIRKANLDELPQLFNVLRGEMSLVGPRPMMVSQLTDYGHRFTAYARMRPGITGLWQTNGRNGTSFEERVRLDAWYVRNWSLWRDFVILVRTARELVVSSGR